MPDARTIGDKKTKMGEQTYTEETEYESLFDNIDDLIEFPSVTDNVISLDSLGCFDFADIWTNGSDEFNDPIFSDANCPSTLSAELAVPHEDVVQLEWLSNFVEDSFSGGGMTMIKKDISVKEEPLVVANYDQFQISSPVSVLESSSSSSSSSSCLGVENSGKMISLSSTIRGPQRARSKRPRPPSFNPRATSELPSQLTMVPVAVSMDLEKLPQAQNGPETAGDGPNEKKRKKPKKYEAEFKAEVESEVQNKTGNGVRKCMHCQITKTPQWRAGPMGPRTLCNACGVRHKSGRLFPEYRPAASPTFVPSLHSNSHKKVVEMRTKCVSEQVMGTSTPSEDAIPNTNL